MQQEQFKSFEKPCEYTRISDWLRVTLALLILDKNDQ